MCFISEALDMQVTWHAEARRVVIRNGVTEIILTIDSDQVLVNGVPTVLDCPAELHSSGRTLVPLRFVSETLGAWVDWDSAMQVITITR